MTDIAQTLAEWIGVSAWVIKAFGILLVALLLIVMTAAGTHYVTRQLRMTNAKLAANEKRLLEKTAQANSANQAKTDFLANISHEIRTPMTAILGFSELLKSEELSNAEQRECLDTVIRNGKHLLTLINQVLDLTKIESGKLEVEVAQCSPQTLLRDIDQLFAGQAEAKGIGFQVRADDSLPAKIESDPTRLKQALVNLVSNAIKFTNDGSVEVSVSCDYDQQLLTFHVTDTGIGMTQEQTERVFQPFLQADSSTTRKYGGTGLGLSITRQIASLLGGSVEVESRIGKGSTFTLTVPVGEAVADACRGSRTGPNGQSLSGTVTKRPGRVLIVDDGIDNRRLLVHILKRADVEVECADDGRQGVNRTLEAWRNDEPFHLVLMDLQMPSVDGYSATEQLRAEGYPGQIVALTAHALKSDMERCLENGFDGYISKPIGFDAFERTVERARQAEALGYDRVWLPETWGRDAVTVLTSIAHGTEEIGIGTSIMPVYSRSPALIGQTAATLQEVSDGRFRLGLGPSGPVVIENWHGVEFGNPLRRTRETVDIVKEVLAGEPVEGGGQVFFVQRDGNERMRKQPGFLGSPAHLVDDRIEILRAHRTVVLRERIAQVLQPHRRRGETRRDHVVQLFPNPPAFRLADLGDPFFERALLRDVDNREDDAVALPICSPVRSKANLERAAFCVAAFHPRRLFAGEHGLGGLPERRSAERGGERINRVVHLHSKQPLSTRSRPPDVEGGIQEKDDGIGRRGEVLQVVAQPLCSGLSCSFAPLCLLERIPICREERGDGELAAFEKRPNLLRGKRTRVRSPAGNDTAVGDAAGQLDVWRC